MENIVAIDIGTTGAKAALIRRDGQIEATGYAEYPTIGGGGNFVEQEVEDWWRAVCSALSHLRRSLPESSARNVAVRNVAAVALSGQMQNTILLGQDRVLGRAILYSDSRAQEEATFLMEHFGYEELTRITGNEQGPASVLAKWLWLRKQEPARLAACQKLLPGAHDYIAWRLCGATATDYTTAATTGLLDLKANDWAYGLLERLGLDAEKLPDLRRPGASLGTVGAEVAGATGIPAGTPVYQGAGDLAATTVGVGAGAPGRLYVYLGTSGWIATSLDEATPNPQGGVFTLRHPDPGRYIQVAPMLTAGGNLAWVRDQIYAPQPGNTRLDAYAVLNQEATSAPAGSHGLIYLPYLSGERSPFSDPHARACFVGLSAQSTRADMVRAVMEGTAMAYRSLRDVLNVEQSGPLYLVGGGARSTIWPQILADVLACPVHVVASPGNAAARGAAVIVGRGLGWYNSYFLDTKFFPISQRYGPDTRRSHLYDDVYTVFRNLYPQLKDTFATIARIEYLG